MSHPIGFIGAAGQRLEAAWHGPRPAGDAADRPTLVLLHEGLGCVELWRDTPARLAELTGLGVFVYSRRGYGRSDPCELPRPTSYMHDEGLLVLPEVLRAVGITRPILFGHSDGASISLIYAGGTPAQGLLGLILEAPHVFIEDCNVEGINAARRAYAEGDLRGRLAKYHGANVDCAFRGWSEPWLQADYRLWNLEEYLPNIGVPTLVIQGEDDEYGTMAQCNAIADGIPHGADVLALPNCGHAPHEEQAEQVEPAIVRFVRTVAGINLP